MKNKENNINLVKEKKECCGCTLCYSICPVNAIVMKKDEEGFEYPSIDINKCINCGLCTKKCNFIKDYARKQDNIQSIIYAAQHKDDTVVKTSSSGGMYTAISDYILKNNGKIFAAFYDEKSKEMYYTTVTKEKERNQTKGSKYIQASLNNTFAKIKEEVQNDRYILFIGTPCTTSGLIKFLEGMNTEKLYICDLICHGVGSPNVFKKYVEYIETKNKTKITKVDFKDKELGWPKIQSFIYDDKKRYPIQMFTRLFNKNLILRPSCYNCKYTNFERPSDITIGDFWGFEKTKLSLKDTKNGISLVIINTEKGLKLFNEIKNDLYYEEASKKECLQPSLVEKVQLPRKREKFFNEFYKKKIEKILEKYSKTSYFDRIKRKLKKIVKKG